MRESLLETQKLTLRQGGRTLVHELSFRLNAGELWCVLGPNGAGKSTFLHAAVGLRAAQGGVLRLGGKAVAEWPAEAAARQRCFLPQSFHDAFSASVLECVMLGRHPYLSRWQWEGENEHALALSRQKFRDVHRLSCLTVLDRDVERAAPRLSCCGAAKRARTPGPAGVQRRRLTCPTKPSPRFYSAPSRGTSASVRRRACRAHIAAAAACSSAIRRGRPRDPV